MQRLLAALPRQAVNRGLAVPAAPRHRNGGPLRRNFARNPDHETRRWKRNDGDETTT